MLKQILIIPDTHAPYHDAEAWSLVMRVARDIRPSVILLLGDFADCYAVSSHAKDPQRPLLLDKELAQVSSMLDQLDSLHPARKIYIEGNHENRLTRYLQDRAPELYTMVQYPDLMRLSKRGWEWVPYKHDIKVGKVYFTHEAGCGTGRTMAHKSLDTYQHSIVTGHGHRLLYAVEGDATMNAMVSCQFGWLGDITTIDYAHRIKAAKNWALGFGVGYMAPDGLMYLQPIPIVYGTCVVNGKLYTAKERKHGTKNTKA